MAAVVMPLLDVRQQGFLFIRGASTNPNDGYGSVGWYALNFGYEERSTRRFGFSVGPVARFSRGRDEDDSDALNGLGDIDDSIRVGGFLEVRSGGWSADVTAVSQDAGEAGDGLLVALRSGYTADVGDQFSVTPGVFANWGDDDYMQGYYGVRAAQSARSGIAQFNAGSGFKDVGLSLRGNYTYSNNVLIRGEVGYQRLLGDAADSPIVDGRGSRDQFRALLGVAYKF